jgi:type III pantothenate kinase
MRLLLDFGNSRLKWAITSSLYSEGSRLSQKGAVSYEDTAISAWVLALHAVPIEEVWFASVVAPELEANVLMQLPALASAPKRFQVTAKAGTLHNLYATPETLGVDRWAVAIGAWGLLKQPCLVVSAGTATTVDLIESSGLGEADYRGGLILPGLDLMLESLHQRTARLPAANGHYCVAPSVANNTDDAMTSGAMDATCGAIERMARRLGESAPCLITGGNAGRVQAALGRKAQVVEELVLEGLAIHALNQH